MNTRHIATYTYMQHVDTHTHRKRINQNFFYKETSNSEKQKKEIYLLRVHREEEQIQRSSDPKVHLQGADMRVRFK